MKHGQVGHRCVYAGADMTTFAVIIVQYFSILLQSSLSLKNDKSFILVS